MTAKLHFVTSLKGGVGKTYVAYNLAQFLTKSTVIDMDQSTRSISDYEMLSAQQFKGLTADAQLDITSVETMLMECHEKGGEYVIDVGSGEFECLGRYLSEHEVDTIMKGEGTDIYLHTMAYGSGKLLDLTKETIIMVLKSMPDAKVVIWRNQLVDEMSPIVEDKDIKNHNKGQILGEIALKHYNDSFFPGVIKRLHDEKLTYDQAKEKAEWPMMDRSRVVRVRANIFDQLDEIFEPEIFEEAEAA